MSKFPPKGTFLYQWGRKRYQIYVFADGKGGTYSECVDEEASVINARNKGRSGEQEVCRWLNSIANKALQDKGYPVPEAPVFQRNQNQSAVGGSDITNSYGLCIEVKRHERLDIDSWWNQCCEASRVFGGEPVLLYRQNGKRKWRAVMMVHVPLPKGNTDSCYMVVRGEITHDDFEKYVYTKVLEHDELGA